jgi:hypothetical protein
LKRTQTSAGTVPHCWADTRYWVTAQSNHISTSTIQLRLLQAKRCRWKGSDGVKQYGNYQEVTQTIPYGHVFDTIQDVADFLVWLRTLVGRQGFRFNKFSNELKETLNWANAVREFLFWTTQEWAPGSAITVSPAADGFELDTNNSIVGRLRNLAGDYSLLDAGGRKIDIREISTKRIGKTFELGQSSPTGGSLQHRTEHSAEGTHIVV